jgi:hypothetical protein
MNVACLVFVMMKVGMFFVIASVALCLESGFICCDCNNILDVPAEAISMVVFVSFVIIFFLEIISFVKLLYVRLKKSV